MNASIECAGTIIVEKPLFQALAVGWGGGEWWLGGFGWW